MAGLLSDQLIEENPIIKAARAASTPVAQGASVPVESTAQASSSSSSTITTRNTEAAENSQGVTRDSTLQAIEAGLQQSNILSTQKANELGAASDKAASVGDLALTNAVNDSIIKTQINVATMEAQQKAYEIFKKRGGAPELLKLAAQKKVAADRVIETQAAVEDSVNLEFSEDPLQWILNKFTLGGTVEEADVAEATFNKIDSIQDNFIQFVSATDRALDDIKITNTAATLKAQQDLITGTAQAKKLQFDIEADKLNAEATQTAINMNNAQTTAQLTKWQIVQQDRTFKATQKDREAIRGRAKKDRRVMETIIDKVIVGRKLLGISINTSIDPEAIANERNSIEAEFSLGGEARTKLESQFDLGIGVVKPTPFQTFNAVALSDESRVLDGKEPMLNTLRASAQEVFIDSQGVPGDVNKQGFKLTPELLEGKVNEKFEAKMKAFSAEIKDGDVSNPNLAPPMQALIEMPGVKDEPLVTEVLSTIFDNESTKDFTPTQLIDVAFAAVRTKSNPEGAISFEQAVQGISAIYSKAAVVNTQRQNRINQGFPAQTSYNVELKNLEFLSFRPVVGGEAFTGEGKTINLLDVVSLRALGVKALSGSGAPAHLERVGLPPNLKRAIKQGATPNFGIIDFLKGAQ